MLEKNSKNFVVGLVFCSSLAVSFSGWSQVPASPESVEQRAPVVLRPNEKTALLKDMREYLRGVQLIVSALAKDDFDTVSKVAESLGIINIVDRPMNFPTISGTRFRDLAGLVHMNFEELAIDAKTHRNAKAMLERLAPLMNRCVTCHENFYLSEKNWN